MLTICPPWGVLNPPLGLAYLEENLTNQGIGVEVYDLNILLYRLTDQSDRNLWETKNDFFWRDLSNTDNLLIKWKSQISHLTDYIAESISPVIGCSVIDPNEYFTCLILKIIKDKAPHKTVIAGGPGCVDHGQRLMLARESQGAIDYFMVGESEQSLPKLVSCLKNGTQPNNIANLIITSKSLKYEKSIIRPDLNTISFPKFSKFDIELYGGKSLAVLWSRGCVGHCLYCKERALLGPHRPSSVNDVIDGLKYYIEILKITNFVIYDSAVNGNPRKLSQICDEIIKLNYKITWSAEAIALNSMSSKLLAKMYKAGCHTLVYGIESGSDDILTGMKKLFDTETASQVLRRTHEAGIKVAINILVGFPEENGDNFQQTIDFLSKNSSWIDRLDGVSTLQIVSGTPLEKQAADFGIILPDTAPHDKWTISDTNTFEIRQKRLKEVLSLARREGFEVGRTFLSDHFPDEMNRKIRVKPSTSLSHNRTIFAPPDKYINHLVSSEASNIQKQKRTSDHFKTILIVTCQALPVSGKPTTGGGLRAYNLGKALEECGHKVLFSLPRHSLTTEVTKKQWQGLAHNGYDIGNIVNTSGAEIVLFCNWGLAAAAKNCRIPAIIDMNGSLVLENYYRRHSNLYLDSITKLSALAKTDYIIAGSETQKAYLTSWCLMAGIQPDSLRIGIVPFSLSADTPDNGDNNEIEFILAGYDWPWLKNMQQIQAVCEELELCGNGSVHLFTSVAPYSDVINEDSSTDLSGNLQSLDLPRLVKHRPLDFSELTKKMTNGTVALDIWQRNPERDLAFPSRTVSYLWAGLPVITNNYGELSKLIQKYQAGWGIDSNDFSELKALTQQIANGGVDIKKYQENARKLFAEHLSRDKTIKDLNKFCCNPSLNRTVSPFVAKYYFMREFSMRLQNQSKNDAELLHLNSQEIKQKNIKLKEKNRECELMGLLNRRPRGFAVFQSWSLIRRRLRRMVPGAPILFYLTALTIIGHFLHLMWTRRNRP